MIMVEIQMIRQVIGEQVYYYGKKYHVTEAVANDFIKNGYAVLVPKKPDTATAKNVTEKR